MRAENVYRECTHRVMYYIRAVDCCVNEGERRVMMKSAALLFRNYHAKKSPFAINRSASRVHCCKATDQYRDAFPPRGKSMRFSNIGMRIGGICPAVWFTAFRRSPTNTKKLRSPIICTGESVFISIHYVVNILFFPCCIIHSDLHFGF